MNLFLKWRNNEEISFCVLLFAVLICKVTSLCDTSIPFMEQEGNIGQTDTFPWLGVLRVHLRNEDKVDIALTGVVLIHREFAIANADDIARIPDRVFKEDSSMMFFVEPDVPWYCRPKAYEIHPEYEVTTINTIAIIQLDLENTGTYQLRPICWNRHNMNVDDNKSLFVTGYIDDNRILEKTFYRVYEKTKSVCKTTYDNAKLNDNKREPAHYLCCYTKTIKGPCIWDNGMILVSNTTKFFNLIGFGVYGPGCSTPARFIELEKYYYWLAEVIYTKNKKEKQIVNKNKGFQEVPIHELFHADPLRQKGALSARRQNALQFEALPALNYSRLFFLNKTFVTYDRNTPDTVYFHHSFHESEWGETPESCKGAHTAFYRDLSQVNSFPYKTELRLQVSLYDLLTQRCICIKVKILGGGKTNTTFDYREIFQLTEPSDNYIIEDTPEELFKYYSHAFLPNERVYQKPRFLSEHNLNRIIANNYYVDLSVDFKNKGSVLIEMFPFKEKNKKSHQIPSRRRDFVLTPEEERLKYLKDKRIKNYKPPTRLMWYDNVLGDYMKPSRTKVPNITGHRGFTKLKNIKPKLLNSMIGKNFSTRNPRNDSINAMSSSETFNIIKVTNKPSSPKQIRYSYNVGNINTHGASMGNLLQIIIAILNAKHILGKI